MDLNFMQAGLLILSKIAYYQSTINRDERDCLDNREPRPPTKYFMLCCMLVHNHVQTVP